MKNSVLKAGIRSKSNRLNKAKNDTHPLPAVNQRLKVETQTDDLMNNFSLMRSLHHRKMRSYTSARQLAQELRRDECMWNASTDTPSKIHGNRRLSWTAPKQEPMRIGVRVQLDHLFKINTVAQTFEAAFSLDCRIPLHAYPDLCVRRPSWEVGELSTEEEKLIPITPGNWDPRLLVDNLIQCTQWNKAGSILMIRVRCPKAESLYTALTKRVAEPTTADCTRYLLEHTKLTSRQVDTIFAAYEREDQIDLDKFKHCVSFRKFIRLRYNISGVLAQNFELLNFPYDEQRLRIKITSVLSRQVLVLEPLGLRSHSSIFDLEDYRIKNIEQRNRHRFLASSFTEGNVWTLIPRQCYSEIEVLALEAAARRHSADKEGSRWFWVSSDEPPTHPNLSSIIDLDSEFSEPSQYDSDIDSTPTVLTVTVLVSRLHNYYVYNIMVPMTVITCIGISTITVPICQVSRRLSVNLTLLLTSIAYKFIVSQDLPNVAYLTFLDKYVLFCLGTLVLYILENVIVAMFAMRVCKSEGRDGTVDALDVVLSDNTTKEELESLERWLDRVSFGVTCAITCVFCVIVCLFVNFANRKRNSTREMFLEKLEETFESYRRNVKAPEQYKRKHRRKVTPKKRAGGDRRVYPNI